MKPLVIGGVGGSGTRVYRAIAGLAGYRMLIAPLPLRVLRPTMHDNLLMRLYFYPRWAGRYVEGQLSERQIRSMRVMCRVLLWSCSPMHYGRGRWGWKNPRTRFFLPFFQSMYPEMIYIHIVRDGRHHAFHPRFTYENTSESLLSPEERRLPDHLRKALFWSRSNEVAMRAMDDGLAGRSTIARFEDLCADPAAETRRIFRFLGTEDEGRVERAAQLVQAPASLDAWRREPAERIREVEEVIGPLLTRQGYDMVAT